MHDTKNKLLVSIADFISCCQNETWISKNLFFIKGLLSHNITNKKKYIIAPIIVTDFSFALINSIHQAFKGCTLLQYICWSYDYITKNNETTKSLFTARTYLCSVHFLKNISKKAKSVIGNLKQGKNILKTFLYAFSLLQNSCTMEELEENLQNIFYIFNEETETEIFYNCLTKTRKKLASRDIEAFLDCELTKKENVDIYGLSFNTKIEGKLSKNSPYVNHFKNIVINCISESKNGKIGMNKNRFYFPDLFKIIEQHFYCIPLWSGIVISKWQLEKYGEIRFSRLSNNPCESFFGHIKNHLIIKKDSMPSELCGILYENLQEKYFNHYNKDENFTKKPLKLKDNVEKWQKKRIIKREKGYYYKNISNFGLFPDYCEDSKDNCTDNTDFDALLSLDGIVNFYQFILN